MKPRVSIKGKLFQNLLIENRFAFRIKGIVKIRIKEARIDLLNLKFR